MAQNKSSHVTITEAAEMLKLHRVTVWRMIRKGELKAEQHRGYLWRIRRSEVEKYKKKWGIK